MKGDFSRDTFDPLNNFSRVLLQQGRVQLDADFNEQAAILLHMLRRLTADLFGPYAIAGGPDAFRVAVEGNAANRRLVAGGGRAYVGGYLVEVPDRELIFTGELEPNGRYIVYLDVWERHVTYHETAAPIREVALGGSDTATRAQVVCRLRAVDELRADAGELIDINVDLACDVLRRRWPAPSAPGMMSAQAAETRGDEACVVPSDSRYRGLENQLYRVEIHRGGDAAEATFKWSRDNGSVVFPLAAPICQMDTLLSLVHLGRDERFGLRPGDWVEIVNDDSSLNERFDAPSPPLHQVAAVDPLERTVTLGSAVEVNMELATRPLLRRWDQRAGEESEGGLTLVDGAARTWRGEAVNARLRLAGAGGRHRGAVRRRPALPPRRLLAHPGAHGHGRHRVAAAAGHDQPAPRGRPSRRALYHAAGRRHHAGQRRPAGRRSPLLCWAIGRAAVQPGVGWVWTPAVGS